MEEEGVYEARPKESKDARRLQLSHLHFARKVEWEKRLSSERGAGFAAREPFMLWVFLEERAEILISR